MTAAAAQLTQEQQDALAKRMAEAQRQFLSTGHVTGHRIDGSAVIARASVHEPLLLDDVCFMVDEQQRTEIAALAGEHIGDVLLDDTVSWFARKLTPDGDGFGEWKHLRSAAECRDFIVSKIRQ